jgi:hypothetical protein
MLCSHLCLGVPSGPAHSGFLTNILRGIGGISELCVNNYIQNLKIFDVWNFHEKILKPAESLLIFQQVTLPVINIVIEFYA